MCTERELGKSASRVRPCLFEIGFSLAARRNLLEFDGGVADFQNAKSPEESITFRDDIDFFAVAQESAPRAAVGNRAVTIELHVGRKLERRWRGRWSWYKALVPRLQNLCSRRRRRHRTKRITASALLFSLLPFRDFPGLNAWS